MDIDLLPGQRDHIEGAVHESSHDRLGESLFHDDVVSSVIGGYVLETVLLLLLKKKRKRG